jgi:beta-lactamase regulating signal transducer with metallopeptidase domain
LHTKHPLHLFLQQLAQVVCWFHPSIWTAACHASLAREYVCDDAAADYGICTTAYLRTLLRIAERQCGANQRFQNIAFSRSRSEIVLRARRLAYHLTRGGDYRRANIFQKRTVICTILLMSCLLSQAWLPFDPMSSSRSRWSPWPTWTAQAGHFFGLNLRDYEEYDRRSRSYEMRCENGAT